MRRLLILGLSLIATPLLSAQDEVGLSSEKWTGLGKNGSVLSLIDEGINTRVADHTGIQAGGDAPRGTQKYFGRRLRGTVTAPVTGHYTFYLSADENAELWLSENASRFTKKRLIGLYRPLKYGKWKMSEVVYLEEGESYYLEALHRDTVRSDHLSIAWSYEPVQQMAIQDVSGTVDQTWTQNDSVLTLDARPRGYRHLSNDGAFYGRPMVGDGKATVDISNLVIEGNSGNVGLMLRESAESSRYIYIALFKDDVVKFWRRTVEGQRTQGGVNRTGFRASEIDRLKLVREGDKVSAYVRVDQEHWYLVNEGSLSGLAETVYVGVAASNSSGNARIQATAKNFQVSPSVPKELIPASQLQPLTADANDVDDDNLPDDWEQEHGLNDDSAFGLHGQYGDLDGDGMNNFEEYELGSNPAEQDVFEGVLLRERWWQLNGSRVKSLTTNRSRFLRAPNERRWISDVDAKSVGVQYATRYRGQIIAPVTGEYTFWIAGDDEAELWFADGSVVKSSEGLVNRYGKRKIAWVQDDRYDRPSTRDEDFDRFSSQKSIRLHLEAGEGYYLEVLHKQGLGSAHVSLAWQVPGQIRQVIPTSAFSSEALPSDDPDNDNLPSAWEIQYGLNPDDNGITDARDGEYGDWDGDKLTNLEEYQLGTDPTKPDTDGDGLNDKEERDYYQSDPLVNEAFVNTLYQTADLPNFSKSSTIWRTNADGSFESRERRGWIEYKLVVTEGNAGIFEIVVSGGAVGSGSVNKLAKLPLELSLNGDLLSRQTINSQNGSSESVRCVTPWLNVGEYTLRIKSMNYKRELKLRLDSVVMNSLGGIDADGNGIVDWYERQLEGQNQLLTHSIESLTSPINIEGITSSFSSLSLSRTTTDGQVAEAVMVGINDGYYADVELNAEATTEVKFRYQNGAKSDTHTVSWLPTNMLLHDELTIRKGDALKLAAWDPNQQFGGSFSFTMNGEEVKNELGEASHTKPWIIDFNEADTYQLTTTWLSDDESESFTSTLTVVVKEADFGESFAVRAYQRRQWDLSGIAGMDIEADNALTWNEIASDDPAVRSFTVDAYEVATRHVIARLPETGQIIARGTIHGFYVALANETKDVSTVYQDEDGTYHHRIVVVADGIPEGVNINFAAYFKGALFENGSRKTYLSFDDFDQNGLGQVILLSKQSKVCHYSGVSFEN